MLFRCQSKVVSSGFAPELILLLLCILCIRYRPICAISYFRYPEILAVKSSNRQMFLICCSSFCRNCRQLGHHKDDCVEPPSGKRSRRQNTSVFRWTIDDSYRGTASLVDRPVNKCWVNLLSLFLINV